MAKEFPTQGNAQMNDSKQLMVEIAGDNTAVNLTVVDVSDDDVTVTDSPAIVYGYYINTVLSANVVNIMDSTDTKVVIPSQCAAGTNVVFGAPVSFETNVIVESVDPATGEVAILWKAA